MVRNRYCCAALKLIVEVDGKAHFTEEGRQHDQRRDAYLRKQGYEILRIPGFDVLEEPDAVRERMVAAIKRRRGE